MFRVRFTKIWKFDHDRVEYVGHGMYSRDENHAVKVIRSRDNPVT